MSTSTDLIALIRLIQTHIGAAHRASELVETMQREGRTELTAAELDGLRTRDDAAKDVLTAAIARAKAEGR